MKTLPLKLMVAILLLTPLWGGVMIDFENNPNLPAQPDNFVAAGAMQTYSQAGIYSVSGGVVLGNPTFLASFPAQGSAPNLYGTADFADPSLSDTLTFMFNLTQNITSLSGVLFNGQPIAETYRVTAMTAGGPQVQTFTDVEDSSSASDFRNFLFSTPLPITELDITTPNSTTNGFDFFVDTVVATSGRVGAVPEPSSFTLLGTAVAGGFLCFRRRKRS